MLRHGDAGVEPVGCSQRLDHCGGQAAPLGPMAVLEFGHGPREFSEREDLDLVRQSGELLTESRLDVSRQAGHWGGELSGDGWVSERGTQPEQPEAGGGNALRCDPVEVLRALAGQDVAQQVVVNDEGGHLRRREIWVVELADELQVSVGAQCLPEEPLPGAGREEDHSVTEVDEGHSSTLIEPPSTAYSRRD